MTLHEGRYVLPDGIVVELITTIGGNWRLQRLDGTPLYYIIHGTIKYIDRTRNTVHLVACNLRVEDLRPLKENNNPQS